MRIASRLGGVAVGAALLTPPAWSQDVQPVFGHRSQGVVTPYNAYPPSCCPPAAPAAPGATPGVLPTMPGATPSTPATPATPGQTPQTPGQPGADQQNAANQPSTDFGQASAAGASSVASGAPAMIGDLLGGGGVGGPLPARFRQNPFFPDELIRNPLGPGFSDRVSRIPEISRGTFKIAEDESPRPIDRFYVNYDYYYGINKSINGPDIPRLNLHEETFGLEKTFLSGDASLGIRVPYIQPESAEFLGPTQVGDLTLITKYAFYNDRETGDLFSAGVAVTVPTGDPVVSTITGERIHPTLIQPYVGYILTAENVFVHGFSSVIVPTDDRDVTFMSNDVGLGYYAYRSKCGWLSSIVPTAELHVNTPLNHRGVRTEPIGLDDIVDVTSGVNFVFQSGSTFSLAYVEALTGPKPFDFQLIAQLNIRFGASRLDANRSGASTPTLSR
jgi:hypothetical protein